MFKKILAATAASLALAACGGSGTDPDPAPEPVTAVPAEFYVVDGFDVTTTEAPAVDLSEYSNDTDGLYVMYADYGTPNCEPGLADRDITNAYYLDCDSNVSIRIHRDAVAATEAAEFYADNNPGNTIYRTDNVTVNGAPGAVEAFIETFGGSK